MNATCTSVSYNDSYYRKFMKLKGFLNLRFWTLAFRNFLAYWFVFRVVPGVQGCL